MKQLKTIKLFSEDNPVFTQSALRGLIHKANPHSTHKGIVAGNGLIESGAIVRLGSRIYIHEAKFFDWVLNKQTADQNMPKVESTFQK